MDDSLLDKLMQVLGRKTPKQIEAQKIVKAKKLKLGCVKLIKDERGKVTVVIPEGMHQLKYKSFLEKHDAQIQEFINSNEATIKL